MGIGLLAGLYLQMLLLASSSSNVLTVTGNGTDLIDAKS